MPEEARRRLAERDDARAGQRGDVDEMRRAELLRVPESVAENQPALGVGVDDFDRLAAGAGQDVARLDRACRPACSRPSGTTPIDLDRRAEQRDRAHRADHGGAAGHVVLHPLHALGRLDRDAAGVEGDAFADQPEDRRARRARGGSCCITIMRGGSALPRRDAEQQPHLQPRDLVFVEDFDRQAGVAADVARPARRTPRRQHVRRLVAQLAREVATTRPGSGRARRRARAPARRRCPARRSTVSRSGGSAGAIAALVAVAVERRQHQPFGDRLHAAAASSPVRGAMDERDARDAALLRRQRAPRSRRGAGARAE